MPVLNFRTMLNSLLVILVANGMASNMSGMLSYSIKNNSSIILAGSSNVNQFRCVVDNHSNSGTISFSPKHPTGTIHFNDASTRIRVASFDCKNPVMNKNLQKSLNASSYPYIEIALLSAKPIDNSQNSNSGQLKTTVSVTIGGICRIVIIELDWSRRNEKEFRFTGSKQLLMSDFNIETPVAALGIIRVNDEIIIHFDFTVRTAPARGTYRCPVAA